MDLSTLVQILNNGIPAGIVGGVTSEMIVRLIDKAKAMFNGKAITKEKIEQLITENIELKETLTKLQDELAKENIVDDIGKINAKNLFYRPIMNGVTIN